MHTVVELHSFQRAARQAGMSDADIVELVDLVAQNPMAGDELRGTGGCRKLRVGAAGRGKSGGYRVITFYSGVQIPVFLLTVFAKGEKSNLTQKECHQLKLLSQQLVEEYVSKFAMLGNNA